MELTRQGTDRSLIVAALALLLATAGCATVQQPQRQNLSSDDEQIRDCARSLKELDAAVVRAGVADIAARRVEGFPYLRVDRFTASFSENALGEEQLREAWIERMRDLDAAGRRVEIANLPVAEIKGLGASGRAELVSRAEQCAALMAEADLRNEFFVELLAQRAVLC